MSQQLPAAGRSKKNLIRAAVAVVAVPVLLLGTAGFANAAELAPLAEYLDDTVAGLDADLLSIFTTLLS